jgi:hypothetical protein
MSKREGIRYLDVLAMPGSELYAHLEKGDMTKAKACYEETEKRERQLMARIDAQEQKNVQAQNRRDESHPVDNNQPEAT